MALSVKVTKHVLLDVLRSRWVVLYALFFLLLTWGLLFFGGVESKALLSLLNVELLLVPLVSLLFGTLYLYNATDFIELLLTQPIARGTLFKGLYAGIMLPLALGGAGGIGLPFLLMGTVNAEEAQILFYLMVVGVFLTAIFVALAFVVALHFGDKAQGMGMAMLLWLAFTLLYDAGVLYFIHVYSDYPIEKAVIGLMALNPVDLARVFLLMQFDIAALMGYTGAVFQRFFGSFLGTILLVLALSLWLVLPLWRGYVLFNRRDF